MSKVKEAEPEGFPEFWREWMPYRRKNDGRGDARTAYRKHILMGAEPQDIIDGARAYLRSLSERDKPYIPLAATWINREAYADWCELEREFQRRQSKKAENVVSIHQPKTGNTLFLSKWNSGEFKREA